MQFQKGTRNRRSGVGDRSNISTFTASARYMARAVAVNSVESKSKQREYASP
jgi:hypothetical protein